MGKFQKSDSADTCARKFLLVSMGGRAQGLACADPGARTPIGASGNFHMYFHCQLGGFQAPKRPLIFTKVYLGSLGLSAYGFQIVK